jgi:hypothetical protein
MSQCLFYGIGKYKILSYTSPPALLRAVLALSFAVQNCEGKAKQGGKKIVLELSAKPIFLKIERFKTKTG